MKRFENEQTEKRTGAREQAHMANQSDRTAGPFYLNPRELATVLHGLRLIQCDGRIEGCAAGDCEHFADASALSNRAIDRLCERLNVAPTVKPFHGKKTPTNLGRKTFTAYCDILSLEAIERRQHYTATDLITDVLTFARSKGWDVEAILQSAQNHLHAETVEHCRKCGKPVTREWATVDYGTGPEAGNTFYYCSEDCRDRH